MKKILAILAILLLVSVPAWAVSTTTIDDLTALTSGASQDQLIIDDVSAGETKKITLVNLTKVYDVRQYGAVGDGSTDDSDAFQAALDSGNDIFVPNTGSSYKITEKLEITTSRQKIYGNGTIDFYGDATEYALFSIYDFNVIENLTINLKNANTNAIDSPTGMSHNQFKRLKINGTGYSNSQVGIMIRGAEKAAGTANNNQYDNLIELCDFGAGAAGNGVAQPVYLYGVAASGKRCNINRILNNRFSNYDVGIELLGDGNIIMGNDFNAPRGGTAGGKYLDITAEQTHSETLIAGNYFDLSGSYADGIDIQSGTSPRSLSFISNVLAEATINNLSSYGYAWLNAYQFRVSQVIPEENGMLMMPVYDRLGTQTSRLVKQEEDGDYLSVIVGGTTLGQGSAVIVSNSGFDANVGNASKIVDAGGGLGLSVLADKSVKIGEYGSGPDFTEIAQFDTSIARLAGKLIRNITKGEPGSGSKTLTAAMLIGGLIDEDPEGNANWTTDTATNIVNAVSNAAIGDTFETLLMNDATAASGYAVTIVSGTSVTLHGSGVTLTEGTNETGLLKCRLTNVTSGSQGVDCYLITNN